MAAATIVSSTEFVATAAGLSCWLWRPREARRQYRSVAPIGDGEWSRRWHGRTCSARGPISRWDDRSESGRSTSLDMLSILRLPNRCKQTTLVQDASELIGLGRIQRI